MASVEQHRRVQSAAKDVLFQLGQTLTPQDSEHTISDRAIRMLADFGITDTWYYDCPALVLAGDRTCLSQSGRDYMPATDEIGPTTLVTVDLSPCMAGVWGDCARSFFVEDGKPVMVPRTPDFIHGMIGLRRLHEQFASIATPGTRFEEVCETASTHMQSLGFINLDFLGNVGHTIESERSQRSFLEKGNDRTLGSAVLFTFEPHIRSHNRHWGYKHEEIYYFSRGRLFML